MDEKEAELYEGIEELSGENCILL